MIILTVITKKEEEVPLVMEHILENKYAKSVQLDHEVNHFLNDKKQLTAVKTPKLSFISKALLYKDIESSLFNRFGKDHFIIYSEPVGQMNEDYGNELRTYLKSV